MKICQDVLFFSSYDCPVLLKITLLTCTKKFNTRTCKQCIYPDKVCVCGGGETKRNIPHQLDHIRNVRLNSHCHILRGTIKTGIFTDEECGKPKTVIMWGHLSGVGLLNLEPREYERKRGMSIFFKYLEISPMSMKEACFAFLLTNLGPMYQT